MNGDMIKNPSGKGMEDAFRLLELTLGNVKNGVSSPLAAQLNMLSVIANVAYMHRNLKALQERWSLRPPFVGEAWAEVNFNAWAERLRRAWKLGRRLAEGSSGLPYFHVEEPVPVDVKGWRLWYLEEAYDRDKDIKQPSKLEKVEYRGMGVEKHIHDLDYQKEYMQSTSSFNEWFFLADDLKEWGCEPKGIRDVSFSLSGPGSEWTLKALDKAMEEMVNKLEELEKLRTGLCVVEVEEAKPVDEVLDAGRLKAMGVNDLQKAKEMLEEERCKQKELERQEKEVLQSKQLSDFYTGIYQEYVDTHGKALVAEYERWMAVYPSPKKTAVMGHRLKGEFEGLLRSGFLDLLLEDHDCTSADVDKAGQVFRAVSYDEEGRIRPLVLARYIYANQFLVEGWRAKTERFFRYIYLESLTGVVPEPKEITNEEVFLPNIHDDIFDYRLDMLKVKRGLAEFTRMRMADGNTLKDRKYLYYVVFNALCDMHWIPKRRDSGKFREWMNKVFEGFAAFSKENYDAGRIQWKKEMDSTDATGKEGVCEEMDMMVWQMFQGRDGGREEHYRKPGTRPICNPDQRKKLE